MQITKGLNCYSAEFQQAFREYFAEYGVVLKEHTDVFDELQKACDTEGMTSFLLWENEKIIAFVLYQVEQFASSSGFFSEKVGYIRELWVQKEHRRQGLATRLMEECFGDFRTEEVKKVLLTYDEDAEKFYLKLGFVYDDSYIAKNGLNCFVKTI